MPRIARLLVENENSVYYIISRTALDGYPIKEYERDYLVQVIQQYSRLFFAEVLGFCVMSTHFHLMVRILSGKQFSAKEIRERHISFFGDDSDFSTDSSIIGTKAFVSSKYHQFQDLFYSTKEKIPNPIEGLAGIYALKKLTE